MVELTYDFETLSTREGFNKSLRHFKQVNDFVSNIQERRNLADALSEALDQKEIQNKQILPIIYALLVDKYNYRSYSYNLEKKVDDFTDLLEAVKKWKAVDIVLVYHHPEMGTTVVNPKNFEHWDSLQMMNKNELLTVYVGAFDKDLNQKTADKTAELFINRLYGKKAAIPQSLTKGSFQPPKPKTQKPASTTKHTGRKASGSKKAKGNGSQVQVSVQTQKSESQPEKTQQQSSSSGVVGTGPMPKKMTPFYAIPVTNELFHNGNVEAWKRVIDSYKNKHPQLEVYIYYEGEAIHDINTLFKWGKVKHGSSIMFRVGGEDIQDVAKLKRYLQQGASPRFEDFLKFPVNKILDLF
ncbi:MAG: hypothetical protein K9L68_03520 [Spirochaetales bacterium]|nr:hypothetical protein [Spirochaetales bacterium]